MEHETFWSLLHDWPHWEFETFLTFVYDVLVGMILWPLVRKFLMHHRSDDQQLLDLQRKVAKLEEMLGLKNKEPHDPQ